MQRPKTDTEGTARAAFQKPCVHGHFPAHSLACAVFTGMQSNNGLGDSMGSRSHQMNDWLGGASVEGDEVEQDPKIFPV